MDLQEHNHLTLPDSMKGIRSRLRTTYVDQDGFLKRKLAKKGDRLSRDLSRFSAEADRLFYRLNKNELGSEIPFDRSTNVLKRLVYSVGVHILRYEQGKVLADTVRRLNKRDELRAVHKSAPDPNVNPFFWVYHLVLGDQKSISRDQRSKSARQLLYAHLHEVPVELLIGFILQTGHREAPRTGDDGYREVWCLT